MSTSTTLTKEQQKKAERKAQAMRQSVTKVKPVVVKHVLNNQAMSIYDIKVSCRNSNSYRTIWRRSTKRPSSIRGPRRRA